MNKKINSLFLLILLCATTIFAGCDESVRDNTDETYIMIESLDASSYCLFVNKEITACTNQLSSMMLLCKNVAKDNYPASEALDSAIESFDIVESAREKVDIMTPPPQYEDNRINTLRLMENASDDIDTMINILSTTPLDTVALEDLSSVMQTDFIALTSEFNIYYK